VAALIAAASGERVRLRTAEPSAAAAALEQAGATVAGGGGGALTIQGLAAERIVAVLADQAVPFSEVSAHRVSLEEAYLDLTRDAVDYRARTDTEVAP
jgi:ABC-2 type transport system ATP-binding protein